MYKVLNSFDGNESIESEVKTSNIYQKIIEDICHAKQSIPRGRGLSYCNASAGRDITSISSLVFNRILEWNSKDREVTVEPGLNLGSLLNFAISNQCYPPVLPGHPAITVGGCLGFNVHGKSQFHSGNFIECIEAIRLFHPDHGEIICSRNSNSDIFFLTIGGMGLTGYVTEIKIRLKAISSNGMEVIRIPAKNLLDSIELMDKYSSGSEAIYSWNDLNLTGVHFGRGIVYVENFKDKNDYANTNYNYKDFGPEIRSVLKYNLFTKFSSQLIGRMYYFKEMLYPKISIYNLHEASFPIHGKEIYYKLFGKNGFREYQMLIPRRSLEQSISSLENLIANSGLGITLGSLKIFRGKQSYLNFSGEGICITLNIPSNKRSIAFIESIDKIVLKAKGIINLSKDSRVTYSFVRNIYPEYENFKSKLTQFDPKKRLNSALRQRLEL